MREHGQADSHNERQTGRSTRPRQLRNREAPWEGSSGSKRMSRRTDLTAVKARPRTATEPHPLGHPPGGGLQSHAQSSRILVDGRHQHRPACAGQPLANGTGRAKLKATVDRDALRPVFPCSQPSTLNHFRADPLARWCGSREDNPPGDPIRQRLSGEPHRCHL